MAYEDSGPVESRAEQPNEAADAVEQLDPARAKRVALWCKQVKAGRDYEPTRKAFKRMREDMDFARIGADKEWADADNYIVPIILRHITKSVADLYAKNPKAQAKRKNRLLATVWDGKPDSLMMAMQGAQMGDPNAIAVLMDAQAVKQQNAMLDRIARTLVILFDHFMGEQEPNLKQQFKQAVRRAKTTGVAYCKVGFQRLMERRPEVETQIADVTMQLAHVERLAAEATEGVLEEDAPEVHELRTMLDDLQGQVEVIVREGPIFDFPRATEIIVDPACRNLKGFVGADWIAHEFHMTPDKVREIYEVDLGGQFTAYSRSETDARQPRETDEKEQKEVCLWEVWDKPSGQVFTIADGYKDFVKEPAPPDVRLDRFWPLFPLSFNDVEHECEIYPVSDVHLLKGPQREFNRAGQGLREHRQANRPFYVTRHGALEREDKAKIASHAAHEVVELNGLLPDQPVENQIQRFVHAPIDPAVYDKNVIFDDVLKTVGSQEALLGGTSGSTATESSIAEQARLSTVASDVDELDEWLTEIARAIGQIMLLELDEATVKRIAGPGAAWPMLSRQEIVEEISLEIKAGSSGRPNKAAELANRERALPYVVQMPGSAGVAGALLMDILDLLDIDVEDAVLEGLPSIVAANAMAGRQVQPGTGDARSDPASQGPQGGQNDPGPGPNENEPGPQPLYPAEATPMNAT